MKVRNIIRMQVVAIGFVAALFLGSATQAQEISNSEWPDGPDVATPGHTAATASTTKATAQTANADVTANQQAVAPQAATADATRIEGGWVMTLLVLGLAGSVVYVLAGAKRASRTFDVRTEHIIRSIPIA